MDSDDTRSSCSEGSCFSTSSAPAADSPLYLQKQLFYNTLQKQPRRNAITAYIHLKNKDQVEDLVQCHIRKNKKSMGSTKHDMQKSRRVQKSRTYKVPHETFIQGATFINMSTGFGNDMFICPVL